MINITRFTRLNPYYKAKEGYYETKEGEMKLNAGILVGCMLLALVLCFVALLIAPSKAYGYTDEQIVNAIFLAEGGYKATYLYGIVSVSYDTEAEARRICFNTVRNQRRRHADHDCDYTYLECLQRRYCPIDAENDPKGLNKNWLRNVRYFLNKEE